MSTHTEINPTLALNRPRSIVPREELLDGAFVAAAIVLGLVGFRTTYGSYACVAIGAVGTLLGIVIAHLSTRLDLPILATTASAAVVFFGLGGAIVLRGTAAGGFAPTVSTVRTLAGTSVHGWAQLLTVLPPVGNSGPLLVLPYLLGLLAGTSGYLLARKTTSPLLQLLVPVGVLSLSILFGTLEPASLLLQGSLLSVVLLSWLAVRQSRVRATVALGVARRHRRILVATVILAAAAVAGTALAPHLPWAGNDRVVLRSYVQPPFDASAYPSPLSAFRNYVDPNGLANKTLLVVGGLPRGGSLQFAVMDTYDGLAWGVSHDAPGTAGAFQRIGASVPVTEPGSSATLHVKLQAYSGVWLPDAGDLHSIAFTGSESAELQDDLRYSVTTGAAVVPQGLLHGEGYTLNVSIPLPKTQAALSRAVAAGTAPDFGDAVPAIVQKRAKQWAGTGTVTGAMLYALAKHLRDGEYSDGTAAHSPSLPGHGEARLQQFLSGSQLVGDDEQYAAAFGLLANALGFPTRVVLGAIPEKGGVVKGKDVHAWDEVDLTGAGWVPFFVTPPKNRKPQRRPTIVVTPNRAPSRVPPPLATTPPTVRSTADTSTAKGRAAHHERHDRLTNALAPFVRASEIVGTPIAALLLVALSIIAAKAARRRRRRLRGLPVQRVSAGWLELVGTALDLGVPRPYSGTRRFVAAQIGLPPLPELANVADAVNFGPAWPNARTAVEYWEDVQRTRRGLLQSLNRRQRIRAALRLASFRRLRLHASEHDL